MNLRHLRDNSPDEIVKARKRAKRVIELLKIAKFKVNQAIAESDGAISYFNKANTKAVDEGGAAPHSQATLDIFGELKTEGERIKGLIERT